MSKMRLYILAACFLSLWTACSGPKVLMQERVLFPRAGADTWWLISHSQPEQKGTSSINLCLLAAAKDDAEMDAVRLYISAFLESTFQSAQSLDPKAQIGSSKRWPLLLQTQADSANGWKMRLERTGLQLHRGEGESSAFKVDIKFTPAPFKSHLFAVEQDAWLLSNVRPSNGASLQLLVLHDLDALLALGSQTVFMDIGLANQHRFVAFFKMQGGTMEILGAETLDAEGNPIAGMHFSLTSLPDATWRSMNGKEYPLGFNLTVGAVEYALRPSIKDQEVRQGRASFWMGGIEAFTGDSKKTAGVGNMVILSR